MPANKDCHEASIANRMKAGNVAEDSKGKYSVSLNINSNISFRLNDQPPCMPVICPHTLPILKGQVIGASKINPEIGMVVFNPQNPRVKFIR